MLLWPGELRRKREDDSGRTGPALFAGTNNQSWVKKKILPMPYWNEFNISTCGTFISAVPTLFVLYTFYKSQFRKTRHKILLNIVTTLEN